MARIDPYTGFRFILEIDGIAQGSFSQVSGFGSRVEPIEYREGGDAPTVRKLPGRVTYPDITLRWGVTDDLQLYRWHRAAVDGHIERKNGSIVLLGDDGQEKVRWNFFQAWPSVWDGPDFDATANAVALHTLTISCERVEQA
ncbi:MAG TPA: phage tail protein [Actinomycetes bacterium]